MALLRAGMDRHMTREPFWRIVWGVGWLLFGLALFGLVLGGLDDGFARTVAVVGLVVWGVGVLGVTVVPWRRRRDV